MEKKHLRYFVGCDQGYCPADFRLERVAGAELACAAFGLTRKLDYDSVSEAVNLQTAMETPFRHSLELQVLLKD